MEMTRQQRRDIINDWRRRGYKIKAYQRQLEHELDPASEEWDRAFDAMTALEDAQEQHKGDLIEATIYDRTVI